MARLITLNFLPTNSSALLPTNVAGGAAISTIPLANPYPYVFPALTRSITFTSTDDLSGTNFTISGTDQFGSAISEVRAGPNNTTVTSAKFYRTITNIAANGNWTNFSVGSGATGTFQWIKTNTLVAPPYFTLTGEVTGTITYSVNQTIDSLGTYSNRGPSFIYQQPTVVQLGNNPLATDGATAVVTVTVPSTAGLSTGNIVTITGVSATVGGITAANLNVTSPITVLTGTTFSYTAAAASNTGAGSPGGGANVSYYYTALPTSFAVTAALTGATTNQIFNLNAPVTAFQCLVTGSTGGSLTFNILQAGIE